MAQSNTIILNASSASPLIEAFASEDMLPGHLVDLLTDGSGQVHKCGGPGGQQGPFMIVVENLLVGKIITDTYVTGERVYIRHFRSGDVCQVRFNPVGAVNSGTILESTGPAALGTFTTAAAHQWGGAMGYVHETAEAGLSGRLITAVVK